MGDVIVRTSLPAIASGLADTELHSWALPSRKLPHQHSGIKNLSPVPD
jgi:hypothetical protein